MLKAPVVNALATKSLRVIPMIAVLTCSFNTGVALGLSAIPVYDICVLVLRTYQLRESESGAK